MAAVYFLRALAAEASQSATLVGVIGWLAFIFLFVVPTILIVTEVGGG